MTTIPMPATELAAAAAQLRTHPNYRLLERLPKPYPDIPDTLPAGGEWIGVVDVETSGLDPDADAIIELSVLPVAIDANGVVVGHGQLQSWLQDPGQPLGDNIIRVTGLTDDDLHGQRLDEGAIMAVLSRCSLLIGHNCRFDASFLDRRLPGTRSMPWACSMTEVQWLELGFPCRRLEHLLVESGAFYSPHRAAADVWAVFQLLQRNAELDPGVCGGTGDGTTYLQLLLASSSAGAVRLRATNAPYEAKHWLKARGYRWDPLKRIWWTDVRMDTYLAEKAAFADAGLPEPAGTQLDAVNRHRI